MSTAVKNILIIKPSSLGDVVTVLPALSALRRNFPQAGISWLVRPEFAPLIKDHPHLDEIILFDRKFLGRAWYNLKATKALLTLITRLRRGRYDIVMDFQGLFRTAALGWLSGGSRRFGMFTAREFAGLFYTHKVTRDEDSIHVVDYYLRMVKAAGATDLSAQFIFPENRTAENSVAKSLSENSIETGNYAVFIPGSAHISKCWPREYFASLAERIMEGFAFSIVAVGAKPEKALIEEIVSCARVPVINLAGRTSLGELVALFRRAAVVITNDTGPGHIAAALGVPLVMIFGPSNPIRLFPYRRPETLAAVEPFKRGLKLQSDNPAHAIDAISVDYVYQKLCEQLEGH
jgi:lipopolysaccharide heptosyltransferase I